MYFIGVELRRFKTGTPARINANIMNFDEIEKKRLIFHPRPSTYSAELMAKKNAKQKPKVTNLAHLECDRDYDFGALERQLFEKQMTG